MKNLIILNPASFMGKALKVKTDVEAALKSYGIEYEIHISKSAEDIISTVKKNLDAFSSFISLGGDGTLHYIANALAGSDKNIGSIPVGSGNDIAKNLNLPDNIDDCCIAIKNHKIQRIDLGLINGTYYYLGVSGAGFDSVVTDLANNTKFPFKGSSKYTYAVYRTILTYTSKKFFLKYDDKERIIDEMFMVVGNMAMYGGGMRIAPKADPADGILDVCIIKRMNKIHFLKTFPSVFEGDHLKDPFVEYLRVKSIEVDSEYNFSVFADGEYICKLPARFEVVPKALNFIVES